MESPAMPGAPSMDGIAVRLRQVIPTPLARNSDGNQGLRCRARTDDLDRDL